MVRDYGVSRLPATAAFRISAIVNGSTIQRPCEQSPPLCDGVFNPFVSQPSSSYVVHFVNSAVQQHISVLARRIMVVCGIGNRELYLRLASLSSHELPASLSKIISEPP